MQVDLCHTLSTETVQIDIPESFATDLEHVVVIKDGEAFQLKSTIPDEIKHKNQLRQKFEDTAFEDLRKTYYSDLNDDSDPEAFEKDFKDKCRELIFVDERYKELESILTEEILHTLCIHFVVYAVCKNKEEKLQAINDAQKSDRCFAKDYAKRLITLFRSISFSDPGSITKFSSDLNLVERFMNNDTRRHAGYNKLYTGVHATVTQLANAFISDGTERTINLVKAFEDTAADKDNPDRQALISKISKILDTTITYYENYILNLDKVREDVAAVGDDLYLSYLTVARGLVSMFINNTDAFLKDTGKPGQDKAFLDECQKRFKMSLDQFSNYFDDLIAAFDDATDNTKPSDLRAVNLNFIWDTLEKYRSSESDTWPVDLARTLYENYNSLFKDVPDNRDENKKSN